MLHLLTAASGRYATVLDPRFAAKAQDMVELRLSSVDVPHHHTAKKQRPQAEAGP
jgi:hypothetical protein